MRLLLLEEEVVRALAAAIRAPAAAVRHSVAMLAMLKQKWPCVINPDLFCYICSDNTLKRSQSPVTQFVQMTYLAHFELSIRNEDKAWVLHIVYKGCRECFRDWTKLSNAQMKFGSPMM